NGTVFTAGEVLSVASGTTGLSRDSHGAWRVVDAPERVELTVVSRGPWGRDSTAVTDPPRPGQYLDLPHRMDDRVAELAVQVAGAAVDADATIDRVANYLRDNYDYTRAPRDVGEDEPLSTFLFDRRTGHCEYFASAQALLLRNLDVPARLVNGFVGGDLDPIDGRLVVRRHHAHSWVEAWNGERWRVVDATPGAGAPVGPSLLAGIGEWIQGLWVSHILGFDGARQTAALTTIGSSFQRVSGQTHTGAVPWLGLTLLCALSLLSAWVVERLLNVSWRRLTGERPKRSGPVARLHRKARAHLQSQGYFPPESLPPLEAAQWLITQIGDGAKPLEELAWLMYRVRYGGESAVDLAPEAQRLAAAVMQVDAQRGIR
ncbi:MAG: hypothetical protein GWP91_25330, partial [Rhodobacterales bacterium]|nr:hypothetical protein [Rhodobacterales bacterium]